jgi:ketosteroid isomerase-like protein
MSEMSRSARNLAIAWIEAWKRKDMEAVADLLAPDFVHVNPFGRLEGGA